MDTKIAIGVIISFLCGSFGYIILIFWVRPIWNYKKIKKMVIQDLTDYLNSINEEDEGESIYGTITHNAENLRRHSVDLTECFYGSLPAWYKILLQSRGESIEDASKHLMGLSNTRNYDHAKNRMEKIRQSLKV